MKRESLRYGMVGGDLGAFIGGVHRTAIAFEGRAFLTAGCFSTHADKNAACGDFLQVAKDRVYPDYQTMAEAESQRSDGIDFVVIVTPNVTHYDIAKAFLSKGIHIVCEKPLCWEVWQAEELEALAKEKGVLFCVTYGYSGFPMLKQARQLVRDGLLGDIVNVNAEYLQEWLIDDIGAGDLSTLKLSMWRKDPNVAGISNCTGDIGSHVEHTVSYVTGLRLKRVAAVLNHFGQPLDLNANMLVELENGANGVYCASQVCVGHANGLVVRVFGTKGAIEWEQENPNVLKYTPKGQPVQIWNRGMGYTTGRAAALSRIPSGHPEGLYESFANIYKTYITALLKTCNGEVLTEDDLDFPSVSEGVVGVRFVHAAVASGKAGAVWTEV